MRPSWFLFFLIVIVCCTIVAECHSSLERHDIHRIILKPERSKKNKKRSRTKSSNKVNGQQAQQYYQDPFFDPFAPTTVYPQQNNIQHHRYANHHDEYHDLIKPRPPKVDDSPILTFPEEDHASPPYYQPEVAASSNHFVPIHQNSDWNPLPTQNNYIVQNPPYHPILTTTTSTPKPKHQRHRKKKPRRKASSTEISTTVSLGVTTVKPPSFQALKMIRAKDSAQQSSQHFVNINHNKSHVKYEVSSKPSPSIKSKLFTTTTSTFRDNAGLKPTTSYEVIEEAKDYSKSMKHTFGGGSSLVPKPVYPLKFPPFLPTVSTFMSAPKKTQLDFGQRSKPF